MLGCAEIKVEEWKDKRVKGWKDERMKGWKSRRSLRSLEIVLRVSINDFILSIFLLIHSLQQIIYSSFLPKTTKFAKFCKVLTTNIKSRAKCGAGCSNKLRKQSSCCVTFKQAKRIWWQKCGAKETQKDETTSGCVEASFFIWKFLSGQFPDFCEDVSESANKD